MSRWKIDDLCHTWNSTYDILPFYIKCFCFAFAAKVNIMKVPDFILAVEFAKYHKNRILNFITHFYRMSYLRIDPVLIMSSLKLHDCHISSSVFAFTAKVNIVEAPDIIRAPFGTSHELQCVATGDPPPLISWLKDGRTVIDASCNRTSNLTTQNKQSN